MCLTTLESCQAKNYEIAALPAVARNDELVKRVHERYLLMISSTVVSAVIG